MKMIRVTDNRQELRRIRKLYLEAFPANERFPFFLMVQKARKGRGELWSLYKDNTWAGMAYVISHNELRYLFYFAIAPSLRGKGCGTAALTAIKKHYAGCRLFLALEQQDPAAPNREQREKRRRFYQNSGLHDLPYLLKEASMIYAIMGNSEKIEPGEYKELMNAYLGFPMRCFLDTRILTDVPSRLK